MMVFPNDYSISARVFMMTASFSKDFPVAVAGNGCFADVGTAWKRCLHCPGNTLRIRKRILTKQPNIFMRYSKDRILGALHVQRYPIILTWNNQGSGHICFEAHRCIRVYH
jgi:hypothetical protein